MTKLEKVMKGLRTCLNYKGTIECGDDCPYLQSETCDTELMKDALELLKAHALYSDALEILKAQEVTKPIRNLGITRCGNCNREIDKYEGVKYCPNCGKAVKWDDENQK